SRITTFRVAIDAGLVVSSILFTEAWHGTHWLILWSPDYYMVYNHWIIGSRSDRAKPVNHRSAQSATRDWVDPERPGFRLHPAWGCCPFGNRSRSALRGYGALWPGSDPPCLAGVCVPMPVVELLRAGIFAARQSRS